MGRQISGQYTISSDNTSEKAIDGTEINGSVARVKNVGDNVMYIGNDGSDDVDNTTGFQLASGGQTTVRLDDTLEGGEIDLHVYGTSTDSLTFITVA